MPPQNGESTLTTVYADILFTYSPPEYQPPHQLFHKACYLYIYQKAPESNGRLEIVINAGKSDQYAFATALDDAQIAHSYKKPTAFSLTPHPDAPFKMPAFDPQGQRKYMYPIRTLDIYYWSPEEALLCLESLRHISGIGAFNVEHVPDIARQGDQDTMSPLISRLEQAAINVKTQQRKHSIASTTYSANPDSVSTYGESHRASPAITASADTTAAFAPMAYNPAAPAASEARTERIKTPPPVEVDGASNTQEARGHFPQRGSFMQQQVNQPLLQQAQYQNSHQPSHLAQQTPLTPVVAPGTPSFPPPPPSQPPTSPPLSSAYHSAVQTPLPFSPPTTAATFARQPSYTLPYGSATTQNGNYQQQYHSTQVQSVSPTPSQQQSLHSPSPQGSYNGLQGYHQSPSPATSLQQQSYAAPPVQQQQQQQRQSGYSSPPLDSHQHSQYQPPSTTVQQQPAQGPYRSQSGYNQSAPIPGQHPQPQQAQQYQQASQQQIQQQASQQQIQQQAPASSYSMYSHAQQPGPAQPYAQNPYNVHNQQYVPTAGEASHAGKPQGTPASRTDRYEKKVGAFLKKLDKKF